MGTMLIVEDDEDILALLRELFEEEGWQVHGCASGSQALREIAARSLDLVLLDLVLPSVDGTTVSVDWSNTAQRTHWVEQLAPGIEKKIKNSTKSATGSGASGSDTSFVNGADKRLTTPFLTGFNDAVVTVYWIALAVILLAFVITWFFKVPPLRQVSALQERADAHGVSATGTIQTQEA